MEAAAGRGAATLGITIACMHSNRCRAEPLRLRAENASFPEIVRWLHWGVGTAYRSYQATIVAPQPFALFMTRSIR
jgi:hypothetical protein